MKTVVAAGKIKCKIILVSIKVVLPYINEQHKLHKKIINGKVTFGI